MCLVACIFTNEASLLSVHLASSLAGSRGSSSESVETGLDGSIPLPGPPVACLCTDGMCSIVQVARLGGVALHTYIQNHTQSAAYF